MINSEFTTNARRIKARELRYRKAIAADLNLERIRETLYEIGNNAAEIRWWDSTGDETLLDELIGDEEESFELRAAMSTLAADAEQMDNDLENEWVPEFFDTFFGGIADSQMLGFDSYEGDYYGLTDGYEQELAQEECRKRLMQLTKKDIIDAYRICFRVAVNYLGIKSRYDSLQGYIDILHGANTGLLQQVKEIEKLWEQVEGQKWDYCDWKLKRQFERMLETLPQEIWVQ